MQLISRRVPKQQSPWRMTVFSPLLCLLSDLVFGMCHTAHSSLGQGGVSPEIRWLPSFCSRDSNNPICNFRISYHATPIIRISTLYVHTISAPLMTLPEHTATIAKGGHWHHQMPDQNKLALTLLQGSILSNFTAILAPQAYTAKTSKRVQSNIVTTVTYWDTTKHPWDDCGSCFKWVFIHFRLFRSLLILLLLILSVVVVFPIFPWDEPSPLLKFFQDVVFWLIWLYFSYTIVLLYAV